MNIDELKSLAKRMRLRALTMAHDSGSNGAHLGGGLSAIEIMATLYGAVMHYDVHNPHDESRDRLIVSKGHCVLAYYTALYEAGFLSENDLLAFEKNGSHFHGHAMRNLNQGVEFSGGSLSMGMSFAVGIALACKKKSLNNHVYTLVGDGECDEGLIWEAAMSASNYGLNNLTVIVDCNKLQYDGYTTQVMNLLSLGEKFKAFGFHVIEVDGHSCSQLVDALSSRSTTQPTCVIAHTIKGKGVSFMENQKEWHHSTLNDVQYQQALEEVKACQ